MSNLTEPKGQRQAKRVHAALAVACALLLSGCASMSASGPTTGQIEKFSKEPSAYGIRVVKVTDVIARRVADSGKAKLFSETFGDADPVGVELAPGDAQKFVGIISSLVFPVVSLENSVNR